MGRRARVGRPHEVAYPGKTFQSTIKYQPALRALLLKAQRRTGHSVTDVLHLCCLEGVRVDSVTADTFSRLTLSLEDRNRLSLSGGDV